MVRNNPYRDLAKQDISFLDRKTYSIIFILRHIFKKSKILNNLDFKCRTKIAEKLKKKKSIGQIFEIPRVKSITPQDFRKKFANPAIPVIFERGCSEWACAGKWSFDFLKQNYGNDDFNLAYHQGFTPEDEQPSDDYHDKIQEKLKIKDLISNISSRGDKYLRFCPIIEVNPELMKDLNLDWLKQMRISFLGCSFQSFIGGKNRKTPIHDDMTAFFYLMPLGKKKWTLFSTAYKPLISPEITVFGHNYSNVKINEPDLKKYPGMNLIDRYEGVLNEGEILYCPSWMWHEVENLSDSWGVGYRFAHIRQAITQSYALFLKRIFLTDPPFWKILEYSFISEDLSKRERHLLTPKVYLD